MDNSFKKIVHVWRKFVENLYVRFQSTPKHNQVPQLLNSKKEKPLPSYFKLVISLLFLYLLYDFLFQKDPQEGNKIGKENVSKVMEENSPELPISTQQEKSLSDNVILEENKQLEKDNDTSMVSLEDLSQSQDNQPQNHDTPKDIRSVDFTSDLTEGATLISQETSQNLSTENLSTENLSTENLSTESFIDSKKDSTHDILIPWSSDRLLSKGRGLVYDCKLETFSCVEKISYVSCRQEQERARLKGEKPLCAVKHVYKNDEDCKIVQQYLVDNGDKHHFCLATSPEL